MSVEENKAIVRRHVEEWSNQNPDVAIDELLTADHVDHGFEQGDDGIEALRRFYITEVNAFPDRTYTVSDIIGEGDKVAIMLDRWCTDPATGQKRWKTGVNIYRMSGGKIQEAWAVWEAERPV